MKLTQRPSPQLGVKVSLQSYWNEVLTQNEKNPFPLAPSDLVKRGEVNHENYLRENVALTEFVNSVMVPEIDLLALTSGFDSLAKGVGILGAGLARDLEWLVHWYSHPKMRGMFTRVIDCSEVAKRNSLEFAQNFNLNPFTVIEAEIPEIWQRKEWEEDSLFAYYAGQFVQNQGVSVKNAVMEHLGAFLKETVSQIRVVYILHPRGEDNPPSKVKWRNTTPYFEKELVAPLEKGFGGKVQIDVLGKHQYFHQTYTLYRFSS